MESHQTLVRVSCAVLVVCCLVGRMRAQSALEEFERLPPDKKQAIILLRQTSVAYSHNMDKLETWSGRARVTRGKTEPPGKGVVSEIEFYWSRELGTRWRWTDVASIDMATGVKSPPERPVEFDGMILGDVYYNNTNHGERSDKRQQLIIQKVQGNSRHQYYAFDPTFHLNMSFQPHSEILNAFTKLIQNGQSSMIVRSEKKCIVIDNDSRFALNRYKYNLERGGNCTLFSARDARTPQNPQALPFFNWTSDWVEIKDIWLPEKVNRTRVGYRVERTQVDGKPIVTVSEKETQTETELIEFLQHRVNEPISPEEFTIDRLRLEPGDAINNLITKTVVEYEGEKTDADNKKDSE